MEVNGAAFQLTCYRLVCYPDVTQTTTRPPAHDDVIRGRTDSARVLSAGGYFRAHSQKFHQTPACFGMSFTPLMRLLYASTPTLAYSGRPYAESQTNLSICWRIPSCL